MRGFIAYTLLAIFALVLQSVFFKNILGDSVVPDFLLLLVLSLALREKSIFALVIAFSLGLLGDFSSGQYLGPQSAGCTLAYLFASQISEKVFVEKGFTLFLLAFICSVIKNITFLFFINIYHEIDFLSLNYFLKILSIAFLTAIFARLVFMLTGAVSGAKSLKDTWGTSSRSNFSLSSFFYISK